jgi:hypothetical protein
MIALFNLCLTRGSVFGRSLDQSDCGGWGKKFSKRALWDMKGVSNIHILGLRRRQSGLCVIRSSSRSSSLMDFPKLTEDFYSPSILTLRLALEVHGRVLALLRAIDCSSSAAPLKDSNPRRCHRRSRKVLERDLFLVLGNLRCKQTIYPYPHVCQPNQFEASREIPQHWTRNSLIGDSCQLSRWMWGWRLQLLTLHSKVSTRRWRRKNTMLRMDVDHVIQYTKIPPSLSHLRG